MVVVTGASSGIGLATASICLARGHTVAGIDLVTNPALEYAAGYKHYTVDASDADSLPELTNVEFLVNNAGTCDPEQSSRYFRDNYESVRNCTRKYGLQPKIVSVVNVASMSAHNGAEFEEYVASKGAVLAYTKWTALQIAQYGATCNSISPGGVITPANKHILLSPELQQRVVKETLLCKWASAKEIAEWIYFLAVHNRSMTGQDVLIDNGETLRTTFIW